MAPLNGHFSQHLKELRQRLLISVLTVFGLSALVYAFSRQISVLWMAPIFQAQPLLDKLVYTNLTEAFIVYLKISFLMGLILSFPVLCYQSWRFAAPGLHQTEKTVILKVVFWATVLFGSGVVFSYFVVMPRALVFLMGFAGSDLEPMPRLGSYMTFVVRTSLTFGLAFEIPFLMVAAGKTGLSSRGYFIKKRPYFYPAIFILAFLLTAGDIFSAGLLAVPLAALYETGILVMKMFSL